MIENLGHRTQGGLVHWGEPDWARGAISVLIGVALLVGGFRSVKRARQSADMPNAFTYRARSEVIAGAGMLLIGVSDALDPLIGTTMEALLLVVLLAVVAAFIVMEIKARSFAKAAANRS